MACDPPVSIADTLELRTAQNSRTSASLLAAWVGVSAASRKDPAGCSRYLLGFAPLTPTYSLPGQRPEATPLWMSFPPRKNRKACAARLLRLSFPSPSGQR